MVAHRFGAPAAIPLLVITMTAALFVVSREAGSSANARASRTGADPAEGVVREAPGTVSGVIRRSRGEIGPTADGGVTSGGQTHPALFTRGGGAVTSVAHRGASAYAPENTIPAVRLGQKQGAHLIEVDVHLTRDDVLVVMHDANLRRTTDAERVFPDRGPWRIGDFSYAEIQRLDAGGWFGDSFANTPVPTLDQVLDVLEESGAGLLLEVKKPGRYPGIGERVASHLAERADRWRLAGRRMLVCSFDWEFVKEFKLRMPAVKVAAIGAPEYDSLPAVAAYADLVNPEFGTVSARYLERVHELGMESYGWTADEPDDIRKLLSIGADGVVTNKPDVLDEVLEPGRG